MSNPIALPEIFQAAFEDFIIPSYETAPFSTIQNRAKVVRSLKAIAGVERIMCKGINRLQNEFGPNGEQVWESSDKDSRIRMVGSGWISIADASGTSIQSSTLGDFLEITFYGTGVNWVCATYSIAADLRVSVDGGAEGSNIWVGTTYSNVLNQRNYSQNTLINLASGLSLGWHTVKLRFAAAVAVRYFGFEVLNQRTDLAVYSGTGVSNGSSQGLSALATSAFNAGVSGTRGARVVKYVQGGVASQAVQEVDATSKYLTLADHTNEEVIRRINFREFGVNRADDFSTLTTSSSRAFTLDDGTTTLVANAVTGGISNGVDTIGFPTTGTSSVTLTFVGTGLDILPVSTTAFSGSFTVLIDGVSVGSITSSLVGVRIVKIASGLPYGTHTVKILLSTVSSGDWLLSDFITYRPKTPSIPAGALKVAAYNVMANYVAANAGALTVSNGILRKDNTREATYVNGTGGVVWAIASDFSSGSSYPSAFYTESNHLNSYVEYTFFGTGFDWKHVSATNQTTNCTITVNGIALNSSFPSASSITVKHSGNGNFSGLSNNSALLSTLVNNILNKNGVSAPASLAVSGLPLGSYKIRFNQSAAATASTYMTSGAIDIITPIHSQEASLKIGSTSLKSVTKYSPEKNIANAGPDLSKAKAWVNFDITNQKISSSFNISAVLRVSAGSFQVFFEKPFKNGLYSIGGLSGVMEMTINLATANWVRVTVNGSTGTPQDTAYASLIFFGEQIDE